MTFPGCRLKNVRIPRHAMTFQQGSHCVGNYTIKIVEICERKRQLFRCKQNVIQNEQIHYQREKSNT